MLIKMLVHRGGATIGSVEYRITDKDNLMGNVVRIDLPNIIRRELINELATNKSKNRLYGGHFPTRKIGDYVDGLWIVMRMLGDKHNFEFDDSAMPVPTAPQGAVA